MAGAEVGAVRRDKLVQLPVEGGGGRGQGEWSVGREGGGQVNGFVVVHCQQSNSCSVMAGKQGRGACSCGVGDCNRGMGGSSSGRTKHTWCLLKGH